jgi:hypothetical protein
MTVRMSQTSTIPPVLVGNEKKIHCPGDALWNKDPRRMGKKTGQKKTGKTLGQTKVQTPLLSLSRTRKVEFIARARDQIALGGGMFALACFEGCDSLWGQERDPLIT